jgi:hypothetical protein
VLSYKAPLYGRKTAQMKINPFDFGEVCRYFPNASSEDKALIYGIVGGTPQYLLQIDDKLSIEENIKNTYLNPTSPLFEETTNLLNFVYKNYSTMQVLTPSQVAGQFPVSGGEHNAFGAISGTMSAAVPAGSDINAIRYEYTLTEPLTAPVEKDQQIGMVRVWLDNTCLAQQNLRAASAVAVEKTPAKDPAEPQDDSEGLWNSILTVALGAVAVLFVLVTILRARAAAKRRRRRRKQAAARRKSRTVQRGRRSR